MSGIIVKHKLPKESRPWWHVGHRLPRNPFNPIQTTQHLEYCGTCQMDVDTQIEAANAQGVDVYRKRCGRCGHIMQWGMGKRHLDSQKPLPKKAFEFISQSGQDRR